MRIARIAFENEGVWVIASEKTIGEEGRFGYEEWMRAEILMTGVVLVFAGIGCSVWAQQQADTYSLYVYPEEHEMYMNLVLLGYGVASLGAGMAVYGYASSPPQPSSKPPAMGGLIPTESAAFCQYCGAPLKDFDFCRKCGRRRPESKT